MEQVTFHNINLTGHRKSACCLGLLVSLEIWVIAEIWHWRSQGFPKGCCHHDLKVFCKTGYNSILLNIIKKYEVKMTHILFRFIIYLSCGRTLRNWRLKSKIRNRLWTSLLVREAVLCQTLLGQTQTKPYWSKFS